MFYRRTVCCAVLVVVGITSTSVAGPKGKIKVPPVTAGSITLDGNFSDWPLASYTQVARQPVYPGALNSDATNASGDHIVWEANRVAGFNDTFVDDWSPDSPSEFGSSVYFAYDEGFLYMLSVFLDDELQDSRDASGFQNFLNDGLEMFLDAKGDSLDPADEAAFPRFDTEDDALANPDVTANPDDFQLTMGLNEFFPTVPGGLGAKQHLERAGTPEIIQQGYDDLLDNTDLSSVGGRNIAAKAYSDLRAAGARNPEILANPNTKFSGYAVEMVIPFGTVDGFTPDHAMGFEMFWRDVDDPDNPDPGFGGAGIFWTDWTQNETVPSDADFGTGLFHTANWGQMEFLPRPSLPGDYNGNQQLDADDLDLQAGAMVNPPSPLPAGYDLDGDKDVDPDDRVKWLHDLKNVYIGDADLNGEFNSGDFVQVFVAGKYETQQGGGLGRRGLERRPAVRQQRLRGRVR